MCYGVLEEERKMKKFICLFVLAFVLAGFSQCDRGKTHIRQDFSDTIFKNKTSEIVVIYKDIDDRHWLVYIIDRKNELCFATMDKELTQISCQHFSDEVIAAESAEKIKQ